MAGLDGRDPVSDVGRDSRRWQFLTAGRAAAGPPNARARSSRVGLSGGVARGQFKDYAPSVFRHLRELFAIDTGT